MNVIFNQFKGNWLMLVGQVNVDGRETTIVGFDEIQIAECLNDEDCVLCAYCVQSNAVKYGSMTKQMNRTLN